MGKRISICIVASLLLTVHPALGQQASGEFDRTPVSLDGTVTGIERSDPYVYLFMNVKDAAGKVTPWKIEFSSRAQLEEQGWTQLRLRAGSNVNVRGWRVTNDSPLLNADSMTTNAGIRLHAAGVSYTYRQDSSSMGRDGRELRAAGTTGELPRTASSLALTGLCGVLFCLTALGIRASRRGWALDH